MLIRDKPEEAADIALKKSPWAMSAGPSSSKVFGVSRKLYQREFLVFRPRKESRT